MYPTTQSWKTGHARWTVLLLMIGLSVGQGPSKGVKTPHHSDGGSSNKDPKTSLCLDPSSIQEGAKSNGITDPANPDHFAESLTSPNNFINFCAGAKLTNGQQFEDESCNSTPMGFLPAKKNYPSVRIVEPSRTKKIKANEPFDIVVAANNIELGFFTSPKSTYFIAPQQLNEKGLVKGHLHVVAQLVDGKNPLDPQKFAFFKGIDDKLVGGKVHTTVDKGLPDGTYRIATMVSAMNHQLVSLGVAKRGIVDDAIYVIVGTGKPSSETLASEGSSDPGAAGGAKLASVGNPGQPKPEGETNLPGGTKPPETSQEKPPADPKKKHSHKKVCRASKHKHSSSRRRS